MGAYRIEKDTLGEVRVPAEPSMGHRRSAPWTISP